MHLPLPDDFHAHLRQGELMPGYVRDLASQFGRAIIMPNTVPAMTSAKAISEYKKQILEAAKDVRPDFEPLMTFKLNPNYTEQDLKDMMAVGVVAGKYYPAGVTTNSADGISDFEAVFPVVAMMEKLGLVLCVHGEEPGEFCLDREPAFIKRVETLAAKFPKLKIVFEHLSSARSVEAVKRLLANVAATFTVHHLMMTLDDIVGDALGQMQARRVRTLKEKDKTVDIDDDAVGGRGPFDSNDEVRVGGVCPERVVMPFGQDLSVGDAVIVGVGIQRVCSVLDFVTVQEAVAVRVRLARVCVVALDLLPVREAVVVRVARTVAQVADVGKLNG